MIHLNAYDREGHRCQFVTVFIQTSYDIYKEDIFTARNEVGAR